MKMCLYTVFFRKVLAYNTWVKLLHKQSVEIACDFFYIYLGNFPLNDFPPQFESNLSIINR